VKQPQTGHLKMLETTHALEREERGFLFFYTKLSLDTNTESPLYSKSRLTSLQFTVLNASNHSRKLKKPHLGLFQFAEESGQLLGRV
jgi:hypothetical protein